MTPAITTMLDLMELARTARERQSLHGLLAILFRSEPGVDLIAELRAPKLRRTLEAAGVTLGKDFHAGPADVLAGELAVEYARLFLGPGHHVSPHESVQLKRGSGTLWGVETAVVKRFMAAAGFELDESSPLLPDHLSVAFEFLAHLTGEEAQAWAWDEQDLAAACLQWQYRFIADHTGRWIGRFADQVREQAELPFYDSFAHFAVEYLAAEKAETYRLMESLKNGVGDPVQ